MGDNNLTYANYLQLDNLLSIQKIQSDDQHDEMLFIIIHQAYELWFKQILHECNLLKKHLKFHALFKIFHSLKRIRCIVKLITQQVDILETMSPKAFALFRKSLGSASGFQSKQFRDIEQTLGINHNQDLNSFSQLNEINNLWRDFLKSCLMHYDKTNDKTRFSLEEHNKYTEIELLLLDLYHNRSLYTEIAEMFLDIDEGIQEWRYRHVKLVERIIGAISMGTGGSSGAEYLQRTISKSFCPQLWKIRSLIFSLGANY